MKGADVKEKISIAVAVIAALGAIVVAIINNWHKDAPSPPLSTDPVGVNANRDPESTAKSVVEISSYAIPSAVNDLHGAVTCHEERTGDSVTVTLYAKKEFYPVGKYRLEEAPPARRLAEGLASLNDSLGRYQVNNLWVTTQVRGAADATPIRGNLD